MMAQEASISRIARETDNEVVICVSVSCFHFQGKIFDISCLTVEEDPCDVSLLNQVNTISLFRIYLLLSLFLNSVHVKINNQQG